jgi:hypothetical protein
MLKYFIIFFLCIFYLDVFSQVVIKEEVNLYTEELGDTLDVLPSMPFYGRVRVERLCNFSYWHTIAALKITAGSQSQTTPCYNCGTSGCSACITGSYIFNFYNVPMGSGVSIEEQRCSLGIPLNVPLRYRRNPSFNNRYSYDGFTLGQWWHLGDVRFIAETPPGCSGATVMLQKEKEFPKFA